MRGSGNVNQKALHVVSVWSDEDGISLGQKTVAEKSNEIVAIPELLEEINIKGSIVTIDAMGTQVKIAEQIRKQKGSYVLAVKGNQGNLHEEIKTYFEDEEELKEIKIHPREKEENKHLIARGERLYEESIGLARTYIAQGISNFEDALDKQDEREISRAYEELKNLLNEIEGEQEF